MYTMPPSFGPERTPKAVYQLILITVCASLITALTDSFFSSLFNSPGLIDFFSLSWWGLNRDFLWQPLTFIFLEDGGYQGITVSYLIGLSFNMIILWMLGTSIHERFGTAPFLRLYFLSGILAGLFTLFIMKILHRYDILSGSTPSILAIMTIWTMLNPNHPVYLLSLISIKAKWLLSLFLGAIVLTNLSSGDMIHLSFLLSGAFFGYAYGAIAWQIESPFSFMHWLDKLLYRSGNRILRLYLKIRYRKSKETGDKIFDIHTGKKMQNDDQFIDEMLAKISRSGEESLTWRERQRMQSISEKKMKN